MNQKQQLDEAWQQRAVLFAKAAPLCAKAAALYAEHEALRTKVAPLYSEGGRLGCLSSTGEPRAKGAALRAKADASQAKVHALSTKLNALYYGGAALYAEVTALRTEGQLIFLNAIVAVLGDALLEWGKDGSCTVDEVMRFLPVAELDSK